MSERTSGQETGPTAPSGLPSASTGTSDAERIAALEAELAEARILVEMAQDQLTKRLHGMTHFGDCAKYKRVGVECTCGMDRIAAYLARTDGTAAARVIDPEQDALAFRVWRSKYQGFMPSLGGMELWNAALAYERTRS